jgi:hypothetical protein
MDTEVHLLAEVLPGHRIVVADPSLPEGETVRVTVTVPESNGRRSALEIIESRPANRSFKSPEEVDEYLRRERNSWDR